MNMKRIREIISSIVIFVYFFLLLRVEGLGSAPGDTVVLSSGRMTAQTQRAGSLGGISSGQPSSYQQQQQQHLQHQQHLQQQHQQHLQQQHHQQQHRNSYNLLSEAMKHAVNHEFSEFL